MSNPSHTRRLACALLAVVMTFAMQSLWLGGLDHDAALTITTAKA